MCPWPRIQAALTDTDALNVTYRSDRGEPRMSVKEAAKARAHGEPAGDCIDCMQCVAVCPTGVDIRNGSQLGCIQCGLCIDACDAVMAKVHRPTRLIAYDTDENLARRKRGEHNVYRLVRPRTILYAALIAVTGCIMLYALVSRSSMNMSVLHVRAPLFTQTVEGGVRNGYTLRFSNKPGEARDFTLNVAGLEGADDDQRRRPAARRRPPHGSYRAGHDARDAGLCRDAPGRRRPASRRRSLSPRSMPIPASENRSWIISSRHERSAGSGALTQSWRLPCPRPWRKTAHFRPTDRAARRRHPRPVFRDFLANIALIYFALHTLHGAELENPYDASQAYNAHIAEARAQDERGWNANVMTRVEGGGERIMVEFRNRGRRADPRPRGDGPLRHPFDAALDRVAKLASDGLDYEGVATPVRPGRWLLVIEANARLGARVPQREQNRGRGYGNEPAAHDDRRAGPVAFRAASARWRRGDGSRCRRRPLRRLHRRDREQV